MNLSKKFSILFLSSLFSTSLFSACFVDHEEKLSQFLQKKYENLPHILKLDISVLDSKVVPNSYGLWKGVKVKLSGQAKHKGKIVPFSEPNIFFTDGCNFTNTLSSLDGEDWASLFEPKIEQKHYSQNHLISGTISSKHKIVVFSDPLCPYCKMNVPPMLDYVKQYPQTFAVYYYHLPLDSIHPAAVELTRLMYMAQVQGKFDAISKAYNSDVSARERDVNKIVEAFNKATGLQFTTQYAENPLAVKSVNHDRDVASELDVRGTPTIYLDGKKVYGNFYETIEKVEK
jgi:predicted DsbA family dithiol-disulfide isomerase